MLDMPHGRDQLRDWMERREFKQREAAKYLQFDETQMSSFLSGRRSPGLTTAVRIERLTGIPVEAWMSSELAETDSTTPASDQNSNVGKA